MEIFENFLPESYVNELEQTLVCYPFPWFYKSNTSHIPQEYPNAVCIDDNTIDSHQFVHIAYNSNGIDSAHFNQLVKMLDFLQIKDKKIIGIYRIKCNLMTTQKDYPNDYYNIAHIDISPEFVHKNTWTFLYYVNDSDGDTVFFNESIKYKNDIVDALTIKTKTTPQKGTGILFPSNQFHTSTPPRNAKTRIVINYVLDMENII